MWQVVGKSGDEVKLIYNTYTESNNSKNFYTNAIQESSEAKTVYCYYKKGCGISLYSGTSDTATKLGTIEENGSFNEITFINAGYDLDGLYDNKFSGYKLIKYNNEYYIWDGEYRYSVAKKISIREDYLYKKLKNNNAYAKYTSNTGWTVQEMFKETYQSTGSKKQILYNAINSNLRGSIVEKNYFYQYETSDNTSLNNEPIYSKTYKDIFGTINPRTDGLNDSETMKVYLGKNFALGYYAFSISFINYNGIAGLSNGKVVVGGSSKCDTYNDFGCQSTYYLNNSGKDKTSYLYYINNNSSNIVGYEIPTAPYIPVITIKGTLLRDNIESYPSSYKEKYPSCTSDKLGTKDCPRLFKFQNGYYSNGTK